MSSIVTNIVLGVGGFLSPLRTASNELLQFQGLFMGLQTAFTGVMALGDAAAAVLSKPFELAGDALEKAGNMQQLETSFKILTGNAEKGLALVGELQQLGASTQFEVLEDLAPAGKSLLAFGESAATIPDTLRRIGDVASGVNTDLNGLASIYGKARIAGVLMTEDLNQLTERGIPVIGEFAKQLGVAESQVKGLAETGALTFPMLERAFVSLTSEGGKFSGMMEAQSKTWNGLKSNFADSFSQVQVAFAKPLIEGLSEPFAELIGELGGITPAAASFGRVIGGLVGDTIELAQVVGSLVSAAKSFAPGLAGIALGFGLVKMSGSAATMALRNQLTALAVAIRSPGEALVGLRMQWQAQLAAMQTQTTGTAAAMRTALAGVGIGVALSAVTYGFSAIMDRANSLKSGAAAMSDIGDAFEKQALGNLRKMGEVGNERERVAMLEQLNGQLDEMREKQSRVDRDFEHLGENAQADQMRADIREQLNQQAGLLEIQINRTRALTADEMRRASATRKTAEATKAQLEALEALEKAFANLAKAKEKAAFDALTPDQQRAKLVKDSGLGTVERIDSEIGKAQRKEADGRLKPEEAARASKLVEIRSQLLDVEKQIAAERERSAEKQRDEAEKLAEANRSAQKFQREGALEILKLTAKARGDVDRVAMIERQQRYDELFGQAQGANLGAMQADSYARQMLEAEERAKLADEEKPTYSRTVADADRRVGLGGAAAGGDLILKENQRQTRELVLQTGYLDEIRRNLAKPQAPAPRPVAVFSRG
jgi:tape measure domain-containing protein